LVIAGRRRVSPFGSRCFGCEGVEIKDETTVLYFYKEKEQQKEPTTKIRRIEKEKSRFNKSKRNKKTRAKRVRKGKEKDNNKLKHLQQLMFQRKK
jgi:hypothetical protein